MHEMALVRNIMEVVVEEAEAAGAAEVTAVHLDVGEGRDIVIELFESLFQFLAREPPLNSRFGVHPRITNR